MYRVNDAIKCRNEMIYSRLPILEFDWWTSGWKITLERVRNVIKVNRNQNRSQFIHQDFVIPYGLKSSFICTPVSFYHWGKKVVCLYFYHHMRVLQVCARITSTRSMVIGLRFKNGFHMRHLPGSTSSTNLKKNHQDIFCKKL